MKPNKLILAALCVACLHSCEQPTGVLQTSTGVSIQYPDQLESVEVVEESLVFTNATTGEETTAPVRERFSLPQGLYNCVYTATITYRTSTPKPADVVHLVGNDPIGWSTRDEYQFENEAGTNVYWLDIPEERAIVGPHVNLNIIVNGDWEIYWGGATKPLVFDEPQMWLWTDNVGTDNDYVIPDGTSYWGTIRFVRPAAGEPAEVTMYTEIKEHKSEPNGIETVLTDEDATPEYFTLQGLRVGSPQQGQIYIVRQGSKVSKVYYR